MITGTHTLLYLDSTLPEDMSSGMEYTETIGKYVLANNKTGMGDAPPPDVRVVGRVLLLGGEQQLSGQRCFVSSRNRPRSTH